jgi:hypothetical protein
LAQNSTFATSSFSVSGQVKRTLSPAFYSLWLMPNLRSGSKAYQLERANGVVETGHVYI